MRPYISLEIAQFFYNPNESTKGMDKENYHPVCHHSKELRRNDRTTSKGYADSGIITNKVYADSGIKRSKVYADSNIRM